jgi:hypothetical protein
MRTTPSGTRTSEVRARRIATRTGRPPMVRVGARETGLMGKVGDATARGNEWLAKLGLSYSIDEVAVLLPEGGKERDDWMACMLNRVGPKEQVTYFNRTTSQVTVNSLPSRYEVEYHFFTSAIEGVRLELMDLRGGYSPLHALYNLTEDGRGRDACIVHASFKVESEAAYRLVTSHMAAQGWSCGQDCSSDYGLFSYWRQPGDDTAMVWLKPRVNLRDGAAAPDWMPEVQELELEGDEDEDELEEFEDEE